MACPTRAAEIPPLIAALYSASEQLPLIVANYVLQRILVARAEYANRLNSWRQCGAARIGA